MFDAAADAVNSLAVEDAPQLTLSLPGAAGDKYMVLLWGYDVSGSFTGSHPIGVLGTLTFGAEAARDALYAVVHRFPGATDARTAIADTLGSWRFPRQVRQARDLKPGTWLIAEIDGSLAIHVSAQLGYDFNMVREAQLLGMTRNLGAKIDAGLKTTFGFDASGRYLLVVGRESPEDSSNAVRLQLFKQSQKRLNFGLNLSVGITGQNDVPTELVQAVFGVHGLQAVKDLHLIEQWTDPNTDLGETATLVIA